MLVALAGVTINLIISVVTVGIISLMYHLGALDTVVTGSYTIMTIIYNILYYIAFLNFLLCFFNLIPIPPLDGHHLVKGFIARKSPKFYMYYNKYGYLFLIVVLFFITPVRNGFFNLIYFLFRAITILFGL